MVEAHRGVKFAWRIRLSMVIAALPILAACTSPQAELSSSKSSAVPLDVEVLDGLVYGTAVDSTGTEVELALDVIAPVGDRGSRPTVVFVHGGSFAFGSRNEYRSEARSWAAAGWVAVSVDYRLQSSEEAGRAPVAALQAVEDVGNALRWLVANAEEYGIDPDRIVAVGGSAGGFVVLSPLLGQAPPGMEVEPFPPLAALVSNGATLEGARPVIGLAEAGPPRVAGPARDGCSSGRDDRRREPDL